MEPCKRTDHSELQQSRLESCTKFGLFSGKTCGKDGRKKTTKCSTAWACERRKKQRKGHVRGERSRGRQRKRWMDNVREDLEERGIQLSTAYGKTKNREVWRNIIRASSSAGWWKGRKKKWEKELSNCLFHFTFIMALAHTHTTWWKFCVEGKLSRGNLLGSVLWKHLAFVKVLISSFVTSFELAV